MRHIPHDRRSFRAAGVMLAIGALMMGLTADLHAQNRPRGKRRAEPPRDAAPSDTSSEASAPATPVEAEPADAAAAPAEAPARPTSAVTAGSGDAPTASPEPTADPDADADLSAIRQELASVMDELVQARALVAMLGKALFKTRVRITLEDRAMPDQQLVALALFLDGAPVFRGDGSSVPSDPAHALFEGFAAPGPHELTIEAEHRARGDDSYRYSLRTSYRFEVVREHRTTLHLILDDDSDMADDFADDREGRYEVTSSLEVEAEPMSR